MGSSWLFEDPGQQQFFEWDLSTLGVDEAYVTVVSPSNFNVSLFHKSSQCVGCPYQLVTSIPGGQNTSLRYDTNSYWSFLALPTSGSLQYVHQAFLQERDPATSCFIEDVSLGEFGIYQLQTEASVCSFETLKEPVFKYGALIFAVVFYVLLFLLWPLFRILFKKFFKKPVISLVNNELRNQIDFRIDRGNGSDFRIDRENQSDFRIDRGNQSDFRIDRENQSDFRIDRENQSDFRIDRENQSDFRIDRGNRNDFLSKFDSRSSQKKIRLQSLDTFRGITIALMILVNYGGGKYWFLEHAPWNGLTLADVVFPWFLWIMGVCIPIGLNSQRNKKIPKWKSFTKIIRRSLKLFFIGIVLNSIGGANQLETYRIPGVLQRFSIAYFVTSSLYLLAGPRKERNCKGFVGAVEDIVVLFPQWVIYALLISGHSICLLYTPIEGCPRGYLGPGGLALFQGGNPSPDCIGGVTRFVDIWVLTSSHLYQTPTAANIYRTSSFDPEGILGTVPTFLQVFLGIQAGQTLLTFQDPRSRLKRWIMWSLFTLIGSLFLTSGTLTEGPFPVNKNLWSISYVLITSCFAFLLLSFCYFVIDFKKFWRGRPFLQAGMNSILLYVGNYVSYNVFPWRYRYGPMRTHLALFPEALFGTTLWIFIALYLYKKGKFYTV